MSSMYEAMKKAAKDNPEFAQELDRAVKANEKRAADEAEAKRLKAAAAYREKMEREQREAQEKERIRREKEIKILSNPRIYPFAYSGRPQARCVAKDDLEFLILLIPTSTCWETSMCHHACFMQCWASNQDISDVWQVLCQLSYILHR